LFSFLAINSQNLTFVPWIFLLAGLIIAFIVLTHPLMGGGDPMTNFFLLYFRFTTIFLYLYQLFHLCSMSSPTLFLPCSLSLYNWLNILFVMLVRGILLTVCDMSVLPYTKCTSLKETVVKDEWEFFLLLLITFIFGLIRLPALKCSLVMYLFFGDYGCYNAFIDSM